MNLSGCREMRPMGTDADMGSIRVLVAEDDRAIRELLVHHLERDGFTPVEAADGQATLRAAREGVDLLLLDIGLPGVDGFEIARIDLALRGPGEFLGARQSGQAMLRFADLETDQWLVESARDTAERLLHSDPATVDAHLARWLGSREDYLKA